ncbi:alanyl-tRNA editing protein [Halobacterium zhouii]|uniref:alanyl-tRNA editing protein n=1 Tax=Halobacterium zhouii TaxID=2902624 RepID=UPI001E5375A6|nr:DHHA1 domain-containing protein [Halobacterium zhouii]
MTASLAPTDPYTTSFASRVTGVDGTAVTLAETYFYPEGGGQPADRGTLGGVPVAHVRETDSGVVHELESEPGFGVDDEVQGEVDPEFRRYCMRAHTASHVLYGAGRRVLDDLGYGGFDISPEKVRVDFETSTDITDDVLVELERLTNRAVWDSHDVTWGEVPTEAAHEREDIAFNTKTEEGVMSDADAIRVVEVGDWDAAACGGTHVRNTSEIGPVEVLARSNPGEGLTRVEFAVGPSAVERRADVRRASRAASRALGVPEGELAGEVERLQTDRDDLQDELADLRMDAIRTRLEDLGDLERGGEWWRVGTVSEFDANDVGDAAKDVVGGDGDAADVVAVAGGDDRAFVVVAATPDATDPEAVVGAVTEEFGGGGGGGATFAQGGGIDAAPREIVQFVRER